MSASQGMVLAAGGTLERTAESSLQVKAKHIDIGAKATPLRDNVPADRQDLGGGPRE